MIHVRHYEPRDRAAIREICCDTADAGRPVENFFHDREFIADVVTRYYTDFEPANCWVAEAGGIVVGYLTGSVRDGRAARVTAWRIVPVAALRAILCGALVRRSTWRMLRSLWQTWRRRGVAPPVAPAHVHINVRAEWRGRQVGRQLWEKFAARVTGRVTASVRADNAGGRRFFESLGFVAVGRQPLVLPHVVTETIVYEKPQ